MRSVGEKNFRKRNYVGQGIPVFGDELQD